MAEVIARLWLIAICAVALHAQADEAACQHLNDTQQAREAAWCYENLAKSAGSDTELARRALLGAARNRNWSHDSAAAARAYAAYVRDSAWDRAATLEYIRLLRYRGDYGAAEHWCDRLLAWNPVDAEVLALRSEVLYWAGNRSFEALRNAEQARSGIAQAAALEAQGLRAAALERLQDLRPPEAGSDMAKFLEGRLREQTRPSSDPSYSVYNDSDGIHNSVRRTAASIPLRGDHAMNLSAAEFVSSAPIGTFTDGRNRASVREFVAAGRVLMAPGVYLALAAGGSNIRGNEVRPIYSAAIEGAPQDRWRLALGVNREYLKVTPRAIDQGVHSDGVSGEVAYWFDSRTSASVKLASRWWSDANRSLQTEGTLSRKWIYSRAFNLDAGTLASHQAFAYDLLAVSGFFTPDRYSRYVGFADVHGEAGRRVTWEMRGEGGRQQITSASDYRRNWSVTTLLSIKLMPKVSLYGSYERKNYSLVARDGWYQGFFVSLRVQR